MLVKYAYGQIYPKLESISESYWYSGVTNPAEPYKNLTVAFQNWRIVEDNIDIEESMNGDGFTISGSYNNKFGQQDFLIKQLASVLSDTDILVKGEDGSRFHWIIYERYTC